MAEELLDLDQLIAKCGYRGAYLHYFRRKINPETIKEKKVRKQTRPTLEHCMCLGLKRMQLRFFRSSAEKPSAADESTGRGGEPEVRARNSRRSAQAEAAGPPPGHLAGEAEFSY